MGGMFGDDDYYGEGCSNSPPVNKEKITRAAMPSFDEYRGVKDEEEEEEVDMGGMFGGDDDYGDEFASASQP